MKATENTTGDRTRTRHKLWKSLRSQRLDDADSDLNVHTRCNLAASQIMNPENVLIRILVPTPHHLHTSSQPFKAPDILQAYAICEKRTKLPLGRHLTTQNLSKRKPSNTIKNSPE